MGKPIEEYWLGNMELLFDRTNEYKLYTHQLSDDTRNEGSCNGHLSLLHAKAVRFTGHGEYLFVLFFCIILMFFNAFIDFFRYA